MYFIKSGDGHGASESGRAEMGFRKENTSLAFWLRSSAEKRKEARSTRNRLTDLEVFLQSAFFTSDCGI